MKFPRRRQGEPSLGDSPCVHAERQGSWLPGRLPWRGAAELCVCPLAFQDCVLFIWVHQPWRSTRGVSLLLAVLTPSVLIVCFLGLSPGVPLVQAGLVSKQPCFTLAASRMCHSTTYRDMLHYKCSVYNCCSQLSAETRLFDCSSHCLITS